MSMVITVKKFPEAFPCDIENLTERDAIRIIAQTKSKGSKLQKDSFQLMESHLAVRKLFQMGLRNEAVKLAEDVIHNADWFQHFDIAQNICKLLVRNAYLTEDLEEIRLYDQMYKHYTEIIQLEYDSQIIYGDLLYNYERGLPVEKQDILRNLSLIKRKMKTTNCMIYYYYYQCMLMIAEDNEYENICLEAIEYYDNLYFLHTSFISIFINKLINHYLKTDNLISSEALIHKHLPKCEEGTGTWFRYQRALIDLNSKQDNLPQALRLCDKVLETPKFKGLTKQDQEEWNVVKEQLKETLVRVN
ncbi:MAG: hypothetical protein P1U56_05335 [Saprospiraceae bacterium]|nr:hypothetical protein [Saprospiraceae bacterium]